MTWYADEIILPASPKAVSLIRSNPQLLPFAYWVKNIEDFAWYRPEHKHELTTHGLLVIRPVRSQEEDSWYNEPLLDWNELVDGESHHSCLDDTSRTQLAEYLDGEEMPSPAFRNFLAGLANQTESTVLYYACSMWGGDIDSEYCLSYSPSEKLMATSSDLEDRPGSDNSLRDGLLAIGIQAPSGFFAPHTRSFPWSDHKL